MKKNLDHACLITGILVAVFTLFVCKGASAQDNARGNPGWMEWGPAYYNAKPVRGGYVRAAAPVYVGVMNPHHFPVADWFTLTFIYEKLILLDAGSRPSVPWLAESWKFLDDVTVVMRLKKGIVFHDGSPFNAASLKYQMDWIMDRDNLAWTRAWMEPLKSVEVMDDYMVKWHFKRPWGAFLGTMASVPGFMVSAKALERDAASTKTKRIQRELVTLRRKAQNQKDPAEAQSAKKSMAALEEQLKQYSSFSKDTRSLDTCPVGTGPFMFESASTDNYIQLKRNPSWWFGRSVGIPDMPYLDGIRVSVIPDPSVRLASLKAGKLDFILADPVQYRIVTGDPDLKAGTMPSNWLVYAAFNHAKGPCKDIRVRQAISHAIDRTALVMGTQFGLGRIASCIYPDDHWTHNPDLKPVRYDPELSKKLLAQAGYAGGLVLKGFTVNLPEFQAVAKALMAMLEKAGITWKPVYVSVPGMMEPLKKLDFDMALTVYPWIQEPDHVATLLYGPDSPLNNGRSRNEKAVSLIKAGRETLEDSRRKQIYFNLEKALYENYEDAWLWWPTAVLVGSKNLYGFNSDMFRLYGEAYHFSHPLWFREGHP